MKNLKSEHVHYMRLAITIVLILLALYAGRSIGFRQGYTYVEEYKDEYIEKSCICIEPEPRRNRFVVPGGLYNST